MKLQTEPKYVNPLNVRATTSWKVDRIDYQKLKCCDYSLRTSDLGSKLQNCYPTKLDLIRSPSWKKMLIVCCSEAM